MGAKRIRLYQLARTLQVDAKRLLEACQRAGMDVKNQLSSVGPDERRAIEALIDPGEKGPPLSPVPKPSEPKPSPLRAAAELD